jgi:ribosomal protein uL24
MKSDTERKKYYTEKLHRKKSRMHVHLSKDLRGKLKTKKRSILVHKEDRVKIMRGPGQGKEARVVRVSTLKRKVFAEDITAKNRKGKENLIALEPSNLLLVGLEPTEERKQIFREEAFRKPEKKEAKPEAKAEAHKHEAHAQEHKPAAAVAPAQQHERAQKAGEQHEPQGGQKSEAPAHGGATHTHEHRPAAESKPPAHSAVKPATR